MQVLISNSLKVTGCPKNLRAEICSKLTMTNPKWTENNRMGRWQGKTKKLLRFYEIDGDAIILPRGFISALLRICKGFNVPVTINDRRNVLTEVEFTFTGTLRQYQADAVQAMLEKHFGTLEAPTGSGKTIMALAIVAARRQPTLIVVHTKELLQQWIDRIENFLGIPKSEIGVIGNGKFKIGKLITVAMVQSLYRCADAVAPHIGFLIVDECHRTPSRTATEAVTAFDCKYMLGLSATPWRRDKLSNLIFWHIGDIHHQVDAAQLVDNGSILKAEVVTRKTDFRPYSDPTMEYSRMLSELTEDAERNRLIASDVVHEAGNGGGICLALSDRKSHCEALQRILTDEYGQSCEVLTGDTPTKKRRDLVDRLSAGKVKVLIATGQLIGEGFDCKDLSTLFLCTPVRFSGRVLQYLGRILRPATGKNRARVYDYVDINVGPLIAAGKARQRVFLAK